jgi:hypothetical protein
MRCAVGLAVIAELGCAHTSPRPPAPVAKCADEQAALVVARDFATRTAQSDGVKVRLDESRVTNEAGQWKIWTLVGEGRVPKDAYLVIRKADCAPDWALLLYEM